MTPQTLSSLGLVFYISICQGCTLKAQQMLQWSINKCPNGPSAPRLSAISNPLWKIAQKIAQTLASSTLAKEGKIFSFGATWNADIVLKETWHQSIGDIKRPLHRNTIHDNQDLCFSWPWGNRVQQIATSFLACMSREKFQGSATIYSSGYLLCA